MYIKLDEIIGDVIVEEGKSSENDFYDTLSLL